MAKKAKKIKVQTVTIEKIANLISKKLYKST